MKSREFMSLLGGAAAAKPFTGRAPQSDRMRCIGVLMGIANDSEAQVRLAGFQHGLQDLGWTEDHPVGLSRVLGMLTVITLTQRSWSGWRRM
jgi:putative ABC transport system substrate-binding protein